MKAKLDNRWADAACGPLSLRVAATPAEVDLLRTALRAGHVPGAGRLAGHVLWQGVCEHDEESGQQVLCAVLCWGGGAAWRLKDREEWIGWDPVTRAKTSKRYPIGSMLAKAPPLCPPGVNAAGARSSPAS